MKTIIFILLIPTFLYADLIGVKEVEIESIGGDHEFIEGELDLEKLSLIKWRNGYAIDDERSSIGFRNNRNVRNRNKSGRCKITQKTYRRKIDSKKYTLTIRSTKQRDFPCVEFKYDSRDKVKITIEDTETESIGHVNLRIEDKR